MLKITARLDTIADELERVDPRLALALDRVSDRLETAGAWNLMPVKKDEIKKLVKVFIAERVGVLNKIHDDYTKSVVQDHLDSIEKFSTEKELNDELVRHLRMTFDEWFESLPGNFTPSKTAEK
jgi:hypothetical protein